MRGFLIGVIVAVFLFVAYQSYAQEPTPTEPAPAAVDLGEASLLLVACNFVHVQAEAQGVGVRWCRRETEEVNGTQAVVAVKILTSQGLKLVVTVHLQKSLWWSQSYTVARA